MIFTLTANGSTAWFSAHDGKVAVQFAYTGGTGTMTLQVDINGTTQNVESGEFTSGPVSRVFELPPRTPVRITLSSASSANITGRIDAAA